MERYKARVRRRRRGKEGSRRIPKCWGVPCDVPPVLVKWEGWGEEVFVKGEVVKGEVQIKVEIVIIRVYNVERKLV